MGYRVVVAGATGNLGRDMLNVLAEREFPADEVAAAAPSKASASVSVRAPSVTVNRRVSPSVATIASSAALTGWA